MGKIKVARLILGGLLAGLVMNVGEFVLNQYVIIDEWPALMERLGLTAISASAFLALFAITFVLGIVTVFVYAAMRPRFGAGPKTAIIAGVTVWVVMMYASVADAAIGTLPVHLLVLTGIWGLVEMVVAAVAGAWVYREST
jgi:hypothetical protein